MIKYTDCKEDIISCWSEAFGDSKEDILFFIENVKNAKCLSYYIEDDIAGMLYLVESSLGQYIYAACTKKKYRKQGIMNELLSFCKNEYDRLCLIPANNDLVEYYRKRGFTDILQTDLLNFNQIDDINEYLFEGCELEQPIVLLYERNR